MLCMEFGHIPCGKIGGICGRTIEAGGLGIPNVPRWPHREIRCPGNPLFQVL